MTPGSHAAPVDVGGRRPAMREAQRPGTVYWIDHYVVGSNDLDRWADFEQKVVGSRPLPSEGPEDRPRFILFQDITPCCHHGAMRSPEPLPPSAGPGKGLPTGGWGKLQAAHAALVVQDQDFWPNYERMWAELPEWEYDRERRQFIGSGPDLPARTARHGSPAGVQWFEIRGRGDDWYDWD